MPEPDRKRICYSGRPWISCGRPPSYWHVTAAHLPLLVLTGIPLLLAEVVPLHWFPLRACTFVWLTGYPCPFCGVTRSFWMMAAGSWRAAWVFCPLGAVVYVLFWGIFLWNAAGMLSGRVLIPSGLFSWIVRHRRAVGLSVLLLLLVHWIYRLVSGLC
ncbi:MAG: DUF2752 domain-containing protein [Kiritimatiellae bacterium]|nr:DUF2752 domain-containing protein [Kiritimatiellia bacterium]